MAERPIEQLSLRDVFTNAEMVVRELTEHLEQSFHPKTRVLQELVKPHATSAEREVVADTSVRNSASAMFASDDFSQTLFQKLDKYLQAIDERAQRAIREK